VHASASEETLPLVRTGQPLNVDAFYRQTPIITGLLTNYYRSFA